MGGNGWPGGSAGPPVALSRSGLTHTRAVEVRPGYSSFTEGGSTVVTRLDGIIGSTGGDPRYQPGPAFAQELAHTVCLLLNAAPRTLSQLVAASGSTESQVRGVLESLAALEAVREAAGTLFINFSLLTRDDTASLHRLVEGTADHLAARIWEKQGAVYDQLHRLAAPGHRGLLRTRLGRHPHAQTVGIRRYWAQLPRRRSLRPHR